MGWTTDLYMFAAATRGRQPRRAARRLFGSQTQSVVATRQLCCYAWNKVTAMSCRERGEIKTATRYEAICDQIYENLPEFARW